MGDDGNGVCVSACVRECVRVCGCVGAVDACLPLPFACPLARPLTRSPSAARPHRPSSPPTRPLTIAPAAPDVRLAGKRQPSSLQSFPTPATTSDAQRHDVAAIQPHPTEHPTKTRRGPRHSDAAAKITHTVLPCPSTAT